MSPAKRVIVSVSGGTADPFEIPEGVEVEIRDYDNGEEAPDNDPGLKVDSMGNRYIEAIWEGPSK